MQVLLFRIDGDIHGIPLVMVDRVIRCVAPTDLPGAPAGIDGCINLAGQVVPLYNVRRRFGAEDRGLRASDVIILARCSGITVGLLADGVAGFHTVRVADWQPMESIGAPAGPIAGVAKTDDGLLVIHDLDRFLAPREQDALSECLRTVAGGDA